MKTQNVILSGMIGLVLVMSVVPVFAGEIPVGGGPDQEEPQVYLIKKVFDVCDQTGGHKSGSEPLPGGSVPPSGQQYGCVDYIGDRFNEYLFTGEQMAVLVAVRHTQGAEAILRADLALDGDPTAKCNEITGTELSGLLNGSSKWYGHNVSSDLSKQPPSKTAGTPTGFDSRFDKLYQCILTATEDMDGEKELTVVAEDQMGNTGESVPDQVWFNPEIYIDVFLSDGTAVEFEPGSAGQTVYSTNTLKIKNEDTSGAGVDIAVWLAGTDLVSSMLPAKCPDSNVLEAENIEFRCKIGTVMNNPWTKLPNPNDKEPCNPVAKQDDKPDECKVAEGYREWDDYSDSWTGKCTCQGAVDIVPDAKIENILYAGHTAECWFRLTYPVPCVGMFDTGEILVFARAI